MLITERPPSDTEGSREKLVDVVREDRLRYDEPSGTYRLRRHADERVGTVVALAVAALLERVPTELPPLSETIDVDALSRIFVSGTDEPSTRISFEYADCFVTVRADDVVTIRPQR